MVFPELPVWPRIILSIFTVLSFLPQLHKIITAKCISGLSPYYVLINLLFATNHFTIYFALCVNDYSGGGIFTYSPSNAADFVNLSHISVVWVLFLLLIILTLFYLPTEDLGQKPFVISIYIAFLLISVIPEFCDVLGVFGNPAASEHDWSVLFFIIGHLVGVNPVLTLLALLSAALQARRILQGPISNAFSVPSLAAQAVVFTLVAVSWVWRVSYGDSPTFGGNLVFDWYFKFGWPVVGNGVFAIVQIVLLCAVIRRKANIKDLSEGSETEPLLDDSS